MPKTPAALSVTVESRILILRNHRVILDNHLGGHEAVVADVDGDGDLDICSKLWDPRPDNGNGGRNHADYLENLSVSKKR